MIKISCLLSSLLVAGTLFCQTATFSYQYHSKIIKSGKFSFTCPDEQLSFEAQASAGYLGAANDPYRQHTKDTGPIPNGTWEIYEVSDVKLLKLRLRPTADVVTSERTGFLIHGIGKDKTIEQSSHGCIIIADRTLRKKLVDAFQKYGTIKLTVKNIITGDGFGS
jgi:Protein of unknown function (DUF2778)